MRAKAKWPGPDGKIKPDLFDGDPLRRQAVVGAVDHVDIFGHGPGDYLVMQGDMANLFGMDTQDLLDSCVALFLVDFHLDLVDELIDFGVGIAPKIKGTVGPFAWTVNQALQGV